MEQAVCSRRADFSVSQGHVAAALVLPREPDRAVAAVMHTSLDQCAGPADDHVVRAPALIGGLAVDNPQIALVAVAVARKQCRYIVAKFAIPKLDVPSENVYIGRIHIVWLDVRPETR